MAYLTDPLFDITVHEMICSKGDFSSLYEISHVNGQFLATFKHVSRPPRGTEIYIRKIPVDARLQEILEFALRAGDVYQIRILMEFSGYNRGYCFVSFFDVKSARKAAVVLNGEKIKGSSVVVKLSFDNNRLELKNVPKDRDVNEIREELSKIIGQGLEKVFILKAEETGETVRCLLRYETHKNAVEARKRVYPSFQMFNRKIEIEWTIPTEMIKAKRLYFENSPREVSKSELYQEIIKYIDPDNMLNMYLQNGFGYILFTNEKVAFEAFTILREKKLCGVYFRFSFMKFHNHFEQERDTGKGGGDECKMGRNTRESSLSQATPAADQENVASPDMYFMSHLAYSRDDSAATSTHSSGSWTSDNMGFNNSWQTPPVPYCVQQPIMLAPLPPPLFPVPSTLPQFPVPNTYGPCAMPMNNVGPIHATSTGQAPRIRPLPLLPMPVMIPNEIWQQRPITQGAIEDSYRLSGIPYPQQNDTVFNKYQQINQPIQVLTLSPVLNNVPYDLTVVQMTEDHYREHFL